MLLLAPALAATLAVLPLDGRGVSAEEADEATELLRDALAADGRFDVPRGTAIGTALALGHETELRHAREQAAAGRALLGKGDARGAVAALDEAVSLHIPAGSAWARRSELADVAWAMADAHLRLGDTPAAKEDLVALAQLWPGYTRSRAQAKGTAAKMFSEIELDAAKEPWEPPSEAQVIALFAALGSDHLLFGSLDGDGTLRLSLHDTDGDVETLSTAVTLPLDALSEEWTHVASEVAQLTGGRGRGRAPEDDVGLAGLDELELDEPSVIQPSAPVRPSRPVKIREGGGGLRYDDGPITGKWWFWLALVGAVGGGTTVAIAASQPAEVVTVHESPVWSVTVVSPLRD
ncbi:MAG: hypothetical protein EXR71_03235 [Myxococcales bacterium]|nr:hypothetical protein [Myxococcales bacterium]